MKLLIYDDNLIEYIFLFTVVLLFNNVVPYSDCFMNPMQGIRFRTIRKGFQNEKL